MSEVCVNCLKLEVDLERLGEDYRKVNNENAKLLKLIDRLTDELRDRSAE